MSGKGFILFWFSALVVAGAFVILGCDAGATEENAFGYDYVTTYGWVPDDGNELDFGSQFGFIPELLAFRSSADWRMNLLSTTFLANGELMNSSLTVAQLDSLYDLGAPCPAEGVVYYGYFPWAVAPSATDTIWVDVYKEKR